MKKNLALLLFTLMGTLAFSSQLCCDLEDDLIDAVEGDDILTQRQIMDAMIHEGCV